MAAQTVTIHDGTSGAEATILASLGFNCFRFRVLHQETPVDLLWAEDGFEDGTKRPSGSGFPLLFPFPGRIQGVEFEWEGKRYTLEAGDGRGNAIHGFVHTRPWRVIEQAESRVVGQFQASVDDPSVLDQWPADFRLTATYEIRQNTLQLSLMAENPSDIPLPCGLGAHPYFSVPLGGDQADDCIIQFPATNQWELKDMLTTGKLIPLPEGANYQQGIKFADMTFDDVFGGLESHDGVRQASVRDPHSGLAMVMRFSDQFRECVVYNPPHRKAVCIEPYTCPPDPFRLTQAGVDAGLILLDPGHSFEVGVSLELRTAPQLTR